MKKKKKDVYKRQKEGTATLDEIAHLISFIKENGGIEYAVQTMNCLLYTSALRK